MENENTFIEQAMRIPQLEQLYVAFSAGTRLPFVTCDEEDFTDQIWTFVEEDKVKHYVDVRRENFQDILAVVKVPKGADAAVFQQSVCLWHRRYHVSGGGEADQDSSGQAGKASRSVSDTGGEETAP